MCDVIMIKPWKVLAFLNIALVAADVLVYPKADPFILLADYYDQEANFGLDIPKRGISVRNPGLHFFSQIFLPSDFPQICLDVFNRRRFQNTISWGFQGGVVLCTCVSIKYPR